MPGADKPKIAPATIRVKIVFSSLPLDDDDPPALGVFTFLPFGFSFPRQLSHFFCPAAAAQKTWRDTNA
jgi:hypothetical protein